MLPLQRAMWRARLPLSARAQHQGPPRFFPTGSRNAIRFPSEADIVRDFRQGNFDRGVQRFCKRPPAKRSNSLHETVILACAQVPDAVAAEAVLRAMPQPTLSAAHNVVVALCREQNVPAAIDVLEKLPSWGIRMDKRIVADVKRAAQRDLFGASEEDLKRLEQVCGIADVSLRPRSLSARATAADLFREDGGDCDAWLRNGGNSVSEGANFQSRKSVKKVMRVESSLRSARGDLNRVREMWGRVQGDNDVKGEVGIMAATVSAFVACGVQGGPLALTALMTWVHQHLYDKRTERGRAEYTENPSSMALLVTSASKAIAAAARPSAQRALSAYDALWRMQLPGFRSSLPLTGAYFKVLQHAELGLASTRERIERTREHLIQLDEQGFSMALGAILRCDERVVDKLVEGREWVGLMRSTGIPLTAHTFNLFAGQMRYCNDPEMVSSLLSEMTEADVTPTAVTYGLVFSACVIPGEYSSLSRRNAINVSVWEDMLAAMEEHMRLSGVAHTSNSRLSLARAYAHLGRTNKALDEFGRYLESSRRGVGIQRGGTRREVEEAYRQMVHNFAHCREGSSDGPAAALLLLQEMREEGMAMDGELMSGAFVACVRAGRGREVVGIGAEWMEEGGGGGLSSCGMRHLLMGLSEDCTAEGWERVRAVVEQDDAVARRREVVEWVRKVVVGYARKRERGVCEEVMRVAGVDVDGLEYVVQGREFLRFRGAGRQQAGGREEGRALEGPALGQGRGGVAGKDAGGEVGRGHHSSSGFGEEGGGLAPVA